MTAGARLRSQSTTDASEGEGACLAEFKGRSHLPLRGKLGWMSPRIWWESDTLDMNVPCGAPGPKLEPHFLPGRFGFCARARGTTMEFLVRDATVDPAVQLTRSAPRRFNSIFSKPRFLPDPAHAPLAFRAAVKRRT